MVPEPDEAHARELLKDSPHLLRADPELRIVRCRACGSEDLEPGPPYAAVSLVCSAAVAGILLAGGYRRAAFAALGIGLVIAWPISATAIACRCRGCGQTYRDMSELDSRPNHS